MLEKILFRTGWGLMLLASLYFALFTAIYLNFEPDVFFLARKPESLVYDPVWRTAFYIHIIAASICLLVGPFQFVPAIRKKSLKAHRLMGKIYAVSILFLGGPTGMYMAFFANGGTWTSVGFFILSLLWIYSTWKAVQLAKARKIQEHRKWMVRSFALSFSAVTLRALWMPLFSILGMDHALILILTSYLNWAPNLLVAEWIIRKRLKVT